MDNDQTAGLIAPDKRGIHVIFFIFLHKKTYILALLMSTHRTIYVFLEKFKKIYFLDEKSALSGAM